MRQFTHLMDVIGAIIVSVFVALLVRVIHNGSQNADRLHVNVRVVETFGVSAASNGSQMIEAHFGRHVLVEEASGDGAFKMVKEYSDVHIQPKLVQLYSEMSNFFEKTVTDYSAVGMTGTFTY